MGSFGFPDASAAALKPFSFAILTDIRPSDNVKVDKVKVDETQQCGDGHLWDPYTKLCRRLICALPGYKIKNGKCVPE